MPSYPVSLRALAVTVTCLLAAASPAAGQTLARTALVPVAGDSIAYRVHLPAGEKPWRSGHQMRVSAGKLMVTVTAFDVSVLRDGSGPGDLMPAGNDADARRAFTTRLLASDSLMLELWDRSVCPYQNVSSVVRKSRSLGGERAAYIRGHYEAEGIYTGWFQTYVTARGGIVYMLSFQTDGDEYEPFEPLIARIRDSFTFAPPPDSSPPR